MAPRGGPCFNISNFFKLNSEFYSDSKSVTLLVTSSIFKEIQPIKVWTKRALAKLDQFICRFGYISFENDGS